LELSFEICILVLSRPAKKPSLDNAVLMKILGLFLSILEIKPERNSFEISAVSAL